MNLWAPWGEGILGDDLCGERGDIVASGGLARDVEWAVAQVWEHFGREKLQEVVHVFCGREAGREERDIVVKVGEAYTSGRVDIEEIRVLIPAVLVVDGDVPVIVDETWSVFLHKADHGGAAGPAREPENKGVGGGGGLRLEVPEEEVLNPTSSQPVYCLGWASQSVLF